MSEIPAPYGDYQPGKIQEKMAELRRRARHEEPAAIITELARLMPDLRGAPGITPWDPMKLDTWARSASEHSAFLSKGEENP